MSRVALRVLAIANLMFYLAMVAINALANLLPINGRNTGAVSDSLPNFFVPAGLTFSIWGVIYLLLGVWAIWQLAGVFMGNLLSADVVERVGIWFLVSSLGNLLWIVSWHYGESLLSLVLMLVVLFSLIALYLRLDIGHSNMSTAGKFVSHLPFSIYLGWITVATVANVTAVLVNLGWDGFGIAGPVWALIMIFIAAAITIAVLVTRGDVGYALVILWAFVGIIIARLDGPMASRMVVVGTIVAGAIVILGMLWTLLRK